MYNIYCHVQCMVLLVVLLLPWLKTALLDQREHFGKLHFTLSGDRNGCLLSTLFTNNHTFDSCTEYVLWCHAQRVTYIPSLFLHGLVIHIWCSKIFCWWMLTGSVAPWCILSLFVPYYSNSPLPFLMLSSTLQRHLLCFPILPKKCVWGQLHEPQ